MNSLDPHKRAQGLYNKDMLPIFYKVLEYLGMAPRDSEGKPAANRRKCGWCKL